VPAPGGEGPRPLTKEARDAITPDELIALAQAANLRFRTGRRRQRDLMEELRLTAPGQNPVAVLLSCIDSRAPAELILDLGLGDVFNCRVAGNVENPDVRGSLEYATAVAGAKLVLVMGHSSCGAVKGAIEGARLGHLTQLLEKLSPAIESTACEGERSAANLAFVDAVARRHVELTVAGIRRKSPVIARLERTGRLALAGAFYDVSTGVVEFTIRGAARRGTGGPGPAEPGPAEGGRGGPAR